MQRFQWSAVTALALAGLAPDRGLAQRPAPPACLVALGGAWRGSGRVANRDILMVQEWRPSVLGAFSELRMTHRPVGDTARVVFEGRGFYRAQGVPDSVAGTWLDARGLVMSLGGGCRDGALVMTWTGDTERGRTTYRVREGKLEVLDEVAMKDGSLREFGRSVLDRVAP